MAVKIQLRRGVASYWTAANPILAQGEMGVELDTKKFKIGDGTSTWLLLGYSSGAISLVDFPEIDDTTVGNPNDGDFLIYSTSTAKWIATTTVQTINVSSTQSSTSTVADNALYVAGGLGVQGTLNLAGGLNAISDIIAPSPTDGSLLIYQSSINKWVASVNLTQQNLDAGEF